MITKEEIENKGWLYTGSAISEENKCYIFEKDNVQIMYMFEKDEMLIADKINDKYYAAQVSELSDLEKVERFYLNKN